MNAYLRKVTEEDMDLLFDWANEPSVRQNSFSTHEISYDEHQQWFKKLLSDPQRCQYIYMYDGEPVGQVRIDMEESSAEIDYSIAVSKRGIGHGKNLLQLLYNQVQTDFPNITKLIGKVKPENVASSRAFLDCGYSEVYKAYEIAVNGIREFTETVKNTGGGILYLTNNSSSLNLYDWLCESEEVYLCSCPITIEQIKNLNPKLILSYNYIYIIKEDVISFMQGNIINMHISYLPWNRGFSPNIWSFIDGTPKGVTIHQISPGLDKGKILYQKECFFDEEKESFASSYYKLQETIVKLFKDNWQNIKDSSYSLKEQIGEGSYHTSKDLKELQSKIPFSWTDNIADFLNRYKQLNKE